MKYKITIVFTAVFIAGNIKLSAQTYYNPKDEINITLTIKEPYKPINYYEIGQNINNMLQEEAAKREALKRYYDQIYYETKNAVYANTYLTDDNGLNHCILSLQNATIDNLQNLNTALKIGRIKPEDYDQKIRTCYYNYIENNQIFLNISRFKYLKLAATETDSLKNIFSREFSTIIKSIIQFNVGFYHTEFIVDGLAESVSATANKNIDQLYYFVTNACDDNLANYQKYWKEIIVKEQQQKKSIKDFNDRWIIMVSKIMNARKDYLNQFNEKEQYEYVKSERKYLDKILGKEFMNKYFGKDRLRYYRINSNGRIFIEMAERQDYKVNKWSPNNLFYMYISEFCKCGNYDPSLFD